MEAKERANMVQEALSQVFQMEFLAEFPIAKITEFRCTLTEETDRGCALMAAAYLDLELGEMVRVHLVQDKKILDTIFKNNGPISTFSAKIDLGYVLGLLSPDARLDLHLLRKIRNDFAHNPEKIGFSDSPIRERCFELKLVSNRDLKNPRHRFTNAMMGVFAHIHAKKLVAVGKEPFANVDLQKHQEKAGEVNTKLMAILENIFEEKKT